MKNTSDRTPGVKTLSVPQITNMYSFDVPPLHFLNDSSFCYESASSSMFLNSMHFFEASIVDAAYIFDMASRIL